MNGHATKSVDRYCELANGKDSCCAKSNSRLDNHHFNEEELEAVGESSHTDCVEMLVFCTDWHTWHFFGLRTNLFDLSPHGQELMADAQLV